MSASGDLTQLQNVLTPPVSRADVQLSRFLSALLVYLAAIDTRATSIETRLTALETQATSFDTRITALEGA